MRDEFRTDVRWIIGRLAPEHRPRAEQDVAALVAAGADSVDGLIAILDRPETGADARQAACWILGRLGRKRSAPALLRVLGDGNASVRAAAARALGELRSRRAVGPLIATLQTDDDAEVRTAAAYALGMLGDGRAVDSMIDVLGDDRELPGVRGMVAEALLDLGDRGAVPPLVAVLTDPAVEVRYWAAFALGGLAGGDAVPSLEHVAATDGSALAGWGTVRAEAVAAVARIKARLAETERV
jgi:HEAT repeat protein